MASHEIIKLEQNLVKRIGNVIALTDKLLALNHDKIKIFIANDHTLVIKGVIKALENFTNIVFVGQAGSFEEIYDKFNYIRPDILLTDDQMPRTDILNDIPKIKKLYPDLKIIMHTLGATDTKISEYIDYVNGYIPMSAQIENYVDGFKKVQAGNNYFVKNDNLNGKLIQCHVTDDRNEFVSIIKNIISKRV